MVETAVVASGTALAGAIVGVTVGLWFWANAMARKHPTPFYRRARWLSRIGALLLVGSVLATTVRLIRQFGAVAEADSSSKATELASGISSVMEQGAPPAALAILCLALSAIVSLTGALQKEVTREQ